MLTLEQIISDADIRVPNAFSEPSKVDWLNEVNHDFFEVVKIPGLATFTTSKDTNGKVLADYPLPPDARGRNTTMVMVGNAIYLSALYDDDFKPGSNYWNIDDATQKITLTPAPPKEGLTGRVRYFRIPKTTFVESNLAVNPDAPPEYHWVYVLGLCERIAKAMADVNLANNYANDYRSALAIAQQNYQLFRPEQAE